MKIPQYVTVEEVKRICGELGISDWTAMEEAKVSQKEAGIILNEVNTSGMNIDIEDFCMGLEVELEHGTRFSDANVTNNHPILTGKIVLAHLKESLDYYKRLEVAELEGDLLQALSAGNSVKVESKLRKLVKARLLLSESEAKQLK
ncbi:MAG: DUF5661 family protein [Nitrospirota bacterium]